jgi:hypothetical protein
VDHDTHLISPRLGASVGLSERPCFRRLGYWSVDHQLGKCTAAVEVMNDASMGRLYVRAVCLVPKARAADMEEAIVDELHKQLFVIARQVKRCRPGGRKSQARTVKVTIDLRPVASAGVEATRQVILSVHLDV